MGRTRFIASLVAAPLLASCAAVYPLDELSSGERDSNPTSYGDPDAADSSVAFSTDGATLAPAISFVGTASSMHAVSASQTSVVRPATIQPGDFVLLVLQEGRSASAVRSTNVIWNPIASGSTGSNGITGSLYYRWATTTEPANYDISVSAYEALTATVVAYRDVDPAASLVATTKTLTSVPLTPPAVAITAAHSVAVFVYVIESSSGSWTTTPPMTRRADSEYIFVGDVDVAEPALNFVAPAPVLGGSQSATRAFVLPLVPKPAP